MLAAPDECVSQESKAERQKESCAFAARFCQALPDANDSLIGRAKCCERCTTHDLRIDDKRDSLLGNKSLSSFQPFKRCSGLTVIHRHREREIEGCHRGKWMSHAIGKSPRVGDASQGPFGISKQPFGHAAYISGAYPRIVSTID